MISRNEIRSEIEFYKDYKEKLIAFKRKLPKGNLFYRTIRNHKRAYVRRNGREKYLGRKDLKEIAGLSNRKEAETALIAINSNIKVLEEMGDKLIDFDTIIPKLTYINGRDKVSRGQAVELIDGIAGIKETYNKNGHVTSDGVVVRSRAELILYEYFKSKGLEFYYEKPLMVGGVVLHPDFTIVRKSDKKEILWEHCGMMERQGYYSEFLRRLNMYASEGFLPYDNLILTYDFGGDSIDMHHIERLLRMMGLI